MNKKQHQYIMVVNLILLANFLLTTIAFFLAHRQGNQGVTLQLFGTGDDGQFYWEQAQNVASGQSWIRTSIYPWLAGMIIRLTGLRDVYVIRIFNYLGYMLLLYFSMKTVALLFHFEENSELKAYIINARIWVLFSFLVYASLQMNLHISILRDIWIYAFYVWAIYLCLRIVQSRGYRILYLLAIIPVLWMLGQFRAYVLVSFLLSLMIYFIYKYIGKNKHAGKMIVFLIIIGVIYYTFFIDFRLPIVNMSLRDGLNYRLSALTEYSGGSQMWINLNQPNILLFLYNYIHSYIGNLFGPLPWHINSFGTLLVFFVEAIPMFIMFVYIIRRRKLLSNPQNFMLLHALVWGALIALSNDNIGTATRLRPVAWILILMILPTLYYKSQQLKSLKKVGTSHAYSLPKK